MSRPGSSWGRYPVAKQQVLAPHWRDLVLPEVVTSMLPYGNGRSYGDSCLNDGGTLLHTRGLDRFIAFDASSGILRCEAGVLLSEILDLVVAKGWFPPVLPGTKFVTVGGAIANDVHGKNHHRAGSFGEHVLSFELLRSDGRRLFCSRTQNVDYFRATIAGLGLTGLITEVELQLKRIGSAWMDCENLRFHNLDEFFQLSADSEKDYEHNVAWIDCSALGADFGRGIFIRANHAAAGEQRSRKTRGLRVPFAPPLSLINRASLRAFNSMYYSRRLAAKETTHFDSYFFPLDAIADWNLIYGPRGFLQYQCVVPQQVSRSAIAELLEIVARSGSSSFLAVLKVFADREASGLLSFARQGTTLALDFPNRGQATLDLLDRLDAVVDAAGGAVYPAKDARMSAPRFQRYFPQWKNMLAFIDPHFSSSFWRRVTE